MTIEDNHIRATKEIPSTIKTTSHSMIIEVSSNMIDENRTMLETLIKMRMIGEAQ